MKILRFATAGLILLGAAQARAEMLIASTSFEEPVVPFVEHVNVPGLFVPVNEYNDSGNPAVDHALVNVNNGLNSPVNYTSVGGELGFSAQYTNTRGPASTGVTDADPVGVYRDYEILTDQILDPTHGMQQYMFGDTDGKVTVTLDSVDLTGLVDPRVSLDFGVRSSSWDTADFGHVWVEINDGMNLSTITLIDTRPNDFDNLPGFENSWHALSAALPTGTIATLKFEADTASVSRMISIDNIRFTAAPEPSGLLLSITGIAMAASGCRRIPATRATRGREAGTSI